MGVIDCTHIKIKKKTPLLGDEYINRKGYHSINVQATCNADEWFTSVGQDLSMIHGYGATQKFVTLQRESFRDRMHYF
nr:unnamed protein product [Callosobruchus chinensis]